MAEALPELTLRDVQAHDAEAITALYGHYVLTSIATFEEVPPGTDEIARRIHAVQSAGLPWLVAIDGDAALLGYAYASPYRSRSAYRYTLENSVYVSPHATGRGIGAALLRALIDRCGDLGYRQILAVIGDSANSASIALHSSLGFEAVGTHRAVGFKHGRWVDVVHMQRAVGNGARTPPER